ncbi:hypothetical protein W97_08700 [Coniosporium apollinis CBS 100218]|uniref:AB hydrolase-1 domain-containing protein n=1 Tax=Coniosporium apollinis (strain CBS 100218) TaxID=1168221 RepID=R7Z5H3_CONA1|nr:uncharacterized protein W97_08700 [Coniosporium apollinis CBS 100218]EON69440.1 hypothetical protein W97_08700 [Coniosporium apollinis CBS 100218]
MVVLFQNKIIYMPSVPPFSRREKMADYANICKPVHWEEKRIRSLDGTEVALCVGGIEISADRSNKEVIVVYFQGNASSLPPRLPSLSNVLKALNHHAASQHPRTQYTIVALSYRGFWTSRGRASQKGIEQDASAALAWVQETYGGLSRDMSLVLWGQSIGAGVATDAAARYLQQTQSSSKPLNIRGLILETPFVSVRNMLVALYPQKWLPYRYLWPFLRNWWDSEAALRTIAERKQPGDMPILLVAASRDEVVPPDQADQLEKLCRELGLQVRRKDVPGALHTEAMAKREGQIAVVEFLNNVGTS